MALTTTPPRSGPLRASYVVLGLFLSLAACTVPTPRSAAPVIPAASMGTSEPDLGQPTEAPASVAGDHSTAPATTGVSPPPTVEIGTVLLGGVASWTDGPTAAGPLLREVLGDWRGERVQVCHGESCVTVELRDFCQCFRGTPDERLIDLNRGEFAALSHPDKGLLQVLIEWP